MRKYHKVYFITKKEYEKLHGNMDLQFRIKSVYYGILFAISLVMLILSLIDFVYKMIGK